MSGSPIIDQTGAAIGVVSTSQFSPVIVSTLSARLVGQIAAAQRELPDPWVCQEGWGFPVSRSSAVKVARPTFVKGVG